MPEIKYEIVDQLACISDIDAKGGWVKELNLVSWNGGEPKYDIRSWNEDHSRMGKGITLSKEEAMALKEALVKKL